MKLEDVEKSKRIEELNHLWNAITNYEKPFEFYGGGAWREIYLPYGVKITLSEIIVEEIKREMEK